MKIEIVYLGNEFAIFKNGQLYYKEYSEYGNLSDNFFVEIQKALEVK